MRRTFTFACLVMALGCADTAPPQMTDVWVTSAAGDRQAQAETVSFDRQATTGPTVRIDPAQRAQVIEGIGSSFTESSAFVLAHLEPAKRAEVMERLYGSSGAQFSLTRTHIGSCDFSVEGKYSYATEPDPTLSQFSVAEDRAGFDKARYPGIRDERYDLLPMIEEALALNPEIKIVASAWTAPPWMKTIDDWYRPGSEANNWQGEGGWLKPEHLSTYADYLLRYIEAYRDEGVPIWGLTPVNEPHGNGGHWESMHFSAESQRDFVRDHLGPQLQARAEQTRLLIYDQNRESLEEWADVIYGDAATRPYVFGAAIHWYSSTFKVFEEAIARVKERYPNCSVIHTEGCIDNLGVPAPEGIEDPDGFQEQGWFQNDAFWWNRTATDWAYSATWAGDDAKNHPMYTPVHRYARNIIVSLNHGLGGWIDWNVVLDKQGGPNHVDNYCGAPVMIDTETGEIYYTPIYEVLAQFSRSIRPGDYAVPVTTDRAELGEDALHASASINAAGLMSIQLLNTTQQPIAYSLEIGEHVARVQIPANAVQTVRVQLNEPKPSSGS